MKLFAEQIAVGSGATFKVLGLLTVSAAATARRKNCVTL